MIIKKHTHTTSTIEHIPGTFWIKSKNEAGETITIYAEYSSNMHQSISNNDKRAWIARSHNTIWIETLVDRDMV